MIIKSLKERNDEDMIDIYREYGGTQIGNIPVTRKHYLRDYYVLGSYNSCCGGSISNDFVSLTTFKRSNKTGC